MLRRKAKERMGQQTTEDNDEQDDDNEETLVQLQQDYKQSLQSSQFIHKARSTSSNSHSISASGPSSSSLPLSTSSSSSSSSSLTSSSSSSSAPKVERFSLFSDIEASQSFVASEKIQAKKKKEEELQAMKRLCPTVLFSHADRLEDGSLPWWTSSIEEIQAKENLKQQKLKAESGLKQKIAELSAKAKGYTGSGPGEQLIRKSGHLIQAVDPAQHIREMLKSQSETEFGRNSVNALSSSSSSAKTDIKSVIASLPVSSSTSYNSSLTSRSSSLSKPSDLNANNSSAKKSKKRSHSSDDNTSSSSDDSSSDSNSDSSSHHKSKKRKKSKSKKKESKKEKKQEKNRKHRKHKDYSSTTSNSTPVTFSSVDIAKLRAERLSREHHDRLNKA